MKSIESGNHEQVVGNSGLGKQELFELLSESNFSKLNSNIKSINSVVVAQLVNELSFSDLQKGRIFQCLGRFKEAKQLYKNVLKDGNAEECQIASLNLSAIYKQGGKYDLARKYANEAISNGESIYADKARLNLILLRILSDKFDLLEVEKIYNQISDELTDKHLLMAGAYCNQWSKQSGTSALDLLSKARELLEKIPDDIEISGRKEQLKNHIKEGFKKFGIESFFVGLKYSSNNDSSYDNLPSALSLATF